MYESIFANAVGATIGRIMVLVIRKLFGQGSVIYSILPKLTPSTQPDRISHEEDLSRAGAKNINKGPSGTYTLEFNGSENTLLDRASGSYVIRNVLRDGRKVSIALIPADDSEYVEVHQP